MKTSKYNYFFSEKDKYYVYNQLTSALTEVDEELYNSLRNNDIKKLPQYLLLELQESNFICDDDLREENIVLCANRNFRYSHKVARITILPTMSCNFQCWYCYENHVKSQMTKESMESVILFCKNLIMGNRPEIFHLDWFGGEPLLFFDDIIYPLAKEIMHFCENENIIFNHTITTNGYLIDDIMVSRFIDLKLNTFQITLDGAKFFHNKTRFSDVDKNTFDKIVNNIIQLCRCIENINMSVRINYTPRNIHTIDEIAYVFPKEIRSKISIEPQLVWQFKNDINPISDLIKEKMDIFKKMGYRLDIILPKGRPCYAENMLQFIINYDLYVYKCTARNFNPQKYSIGKIDNNGKFKPNSNYYNYFVSSYMENNECLKCPLLPSCCGMCIQKKIEGSIPKCPKDQIQKSLHNALLTILSNN